MALGTGAIGGKTLRERVQNLAGRYEILIGSLDETVTRTDGALFGGRPRAEDNAKAEGAMADSIESDLTRLEIASNRLENLLKEAEGMEARVRGVRPEGAAEGYPTQTAPYRELRVR